MTHLYRSSLCASRRDMSIGSRCNTQQHRCCLQKRRQRNLLCHCCPALSAWAYASDWHGPVALSAACSMCVRCDTHAEPHLQSVAQSPHLHHSRGACLNASQQEIKNQSSLPSTKHWLRVLAESVGVKGCLPEKEAPTTTTVLFVKTSLCLKL